MRLSYSLHTRLCPNWRRCETVEPGLCGLLKVYCFIESRFRAWLCVSRLCRRGLPVFATTNHIRIVFGCFRAGKEVCQFWQAVIHVILAFYHLNGLRVGASLIMAVAHICINAGSRILQLTTLVAEISFANTPVSTRLPHQYTYSCMQFSTLKANSSLTG